MKYITGHVWLSEGTSRDSILLQQIQYGRQNLVLACVCDGGTAGAEITGQLMLWLAEEGLYFFDKRKTDKRIERELEHRLNSWQTDAGQEVNLSGILIADQDCWLMQGKEGCIYLLNRRFQKTHRRVLSQAASAGFQVTEGRVQKNVGILLGGKAFLNSVPKETMLQCLAAQDITREEQIDRRLAELAGESRRQRYAGACSAVYIRSV